MKYIFALLGTLFLAATIGFVSYGYSCADALILQPATTYRLAADTAGEGWTIYETAYYTDDRHVYWFASDGRKIEVAATRTDGKWKITSRPALH